VRLLRRNQKAAEDRSAPVAAPLRATARGIRSQRERRLMAWTQQGSATSTGDASPVGSPERHSPCQASPAPSQAATRPVAAACPAREDQQSVPAAAMAHSAPQNESLPSCERRRFDRPVHQCQVEVRCSHAYAAL